ncbi:MAG: TetR/AcrR family transcriptional regulator C-terminal domain-containing protein [bacterium]|nr:TetR/AcrR family transcriptional regulator C-terminal domain-containing protein [bacterium]
MSKAEDLRIIKTKKALFNSLLELMRTNSFEEIKISDICKNALINRSTFYSHFTDKYELFMSLLNTQKSILLDELKKNDQDINTKQYFMEVLKIIIDHVDKNRDIYSSILLNNRNSILMDILLDSANKYIDEHIREKSEISSSVLPISIIYKFYFGAILSIGIEWLTNSEKYTKEQLILYLDKLIPEKI